MLGYEFLNCMLCMCFVVPFCKCVLYILLITLLKKEKQELMFSVPFKFSVNQLFSEPHIQVKHDLEHEMTGFVINYIYYIIIIFNMASNYCH